MTTINPAAVQAARLVWAERASTGAVGDAEAHIVALLEAAAPHLVGVRATPGHQPGPRIICEPCGHECPDEGPHAEEDASCSCCDLVKDADQCPHQPAPEVENVDCEHCGIHGQLADIIGAAHAECVGQFVDHEFVADRIADAVLSSGLVVPVGEVGHDRTRPVRAAEHERVVAERDAALAAVQSAKADAWDEGYARGSEDEFRWRNNGPKTVTDNPHRDAATEPAPVLADANDQPTQIPARLLSGEHVGRTLRYVGDDLRVDSVTHGGDPFLHLPFVQLRVTLTDTVNDDYAEMGLAFEPDDLVTLLAETGGA